MSVQKIAHAALRLTIDPASLGFIDTSELAELPLPWVGQERAHQAARFGLQIDHPDYNLFVLGEPGSGRAALLTALMTSEAKLRPTPPDLCYLYNVEFPDRPRALRMPAGQGRVLRQRMGQFVRMLESEIPKRFKGADFRAASERIEMAAKAQDDAAFAELGRYADAHRFGLVREQGNMVFTLKDANGKPYTADMTAALDQAQRAEIDLAEAALCKEIAVYLDKVRHLERERNEQLDRLRRQTVRPMLEQECQSIGSSLRKQIKDGVKLSSFFDQVRDEILDNLDLFDDPDEDDEALLADRATLLSHLRVNVVVDNHDRDGAPVIVEENPLMRNLFGSIDYASDNGTMVADFFGIRAGSLLKAHGGFLLLHLRDLMVDPLVWERLRRFLRSGRLQVEESGVFSVPLPAVSLTPDPVDVSVKVVLVASAHEYYAVQEMDPEFARRFRCKVDFAESFIATPDTRRATAIFIGRQCHTMGLPHFTAAAVAAVLEEAHRTTQDQARQSALFAQSEALVIESAAVARARGATWVDDVDVAAARQARIHREDYLEQRLQETLADRERLLDVQSSKVGQVNGLTVMDLGDYPFGFPVRVTARTYAGERGLLNVEREAALSGPIHDKGMLILQSYLSSLFAHIAPLALEASVAFEQQYSGIEGDSASCAEFYALLSSLAEVPVRQGIAVTGAVNQNGEMMPVGGINQKIEGWFRSCELLGLDGEQGVLIPSRNVRHLMLDRRIVDAVAAGRFHIHAADLASEGMAFLCGMDFGIGGVDGYPADSVLGRAQRRLQDFRRACEPVQRSPAGARDAGVADQVGNAQDKAGELPGRAR